LLTNLLDNFTTAELKQYQIFVHKSPSDEPVRIGRYVLNTLDANGLARDCIDAGSDYAHLYLSDLRGRLALTRNPEIVKVPDFGLFYEEMKSVSSETQERWHRILLVLFEEMSFRSWDEFWREFDDEQSLLLAAGHPGYPADGLRNHPFAARVACFLHIGKFDAGFVVPFSGDTLHVLWPYRHLVNDGVAALQRALGQESIVPSDLPPAVASYSRFLARAKRHEEAGLMDDAFLHHIIALDLLLGDSRGSTAAVSGRAGVLVSAGDLKLFEDTAKLVKRLYQDRSAFVHSGKATPKGALAEARGITSPILMALLRASKRSLCQPKGIDNYLKLLDHCKTTMELGRALSPADLEDCGLDRG
jgi:hypothetical protein